MRISGLLQGKGIVGGRLTGVAWSIAISNTLRRRGLQRTDEMPFEAHGAQFRDLVNAFLEIALTERPLSGCGSFTQARRRPGLAHGKQEDVGRITSPPPCSAGDSRENGLQLGGKCGHNQALRRFCIV